MDFLPLFLKLRGRPALVVGGGRIATRRAQALLRAGARLRVVAPAPSDSLLLLAKRGRVTLFKRAFEDADIDGAFLVVAATDDAALNARIASLCEVAGALVNDVSDAAAGNALFPPTIERDPIRIAISSEGAAPTLSRMLKEHLGNCVPDAYRRLAELAGRRRAAVAEQLPEFEQRRLFWRRTLGGRAAEFAFAGRMDAAEREFERLLDPAALQSATGEVYLVGAGPGDPDLLTFKALRLMQKADVVVYDRLVSEPILQMLPEAAEKIYAGKERDRHALPQDRINSLLVSLAREGKNVLRLKGGDPFIFGRGGEEIDTLIDAGIPFQVAPGITAASGCAAYSGIPLTHRDYASSCVFLTGQCKDGEVKLDWPRLAARDQTLVFYMSLMGLPIVCRKLRDAGLPDATPAALITRGTTPEQRVLVGSLASLPELVARAQVKPPTLLVVGEVVQLYKKLRWFRIERDAEGGATA